MEIYDKFDLGNFTSETIPFVAKEMYDKLTELKSRTGVAIDSLEKLASFDDAIVLTGGTYTNLSLTKNVYLCDCTSGDIIISSIDPSAKSGKRVLFFKTDNTQYKVVLKNTTNGGFVDYITNDDIEILLENGSVEYQNS